MTDTSSITSSTGTIVDRYLETWNETDRERRRGLVQRTFADDATYVDPLMASRGHTAIENMIAAVQEQYPGHRFVTSGRPDAHSDRLRFSWHLVREDGRPIALGIDFAEVAEDGRLRSITGFLEHP